MTAPYLKRFYFNDRKLKQRALVEFSRALSTGRMIAFTGSMTTESAGYPAWRALRAVYLETARALLRKTRANAPPTAISAINEAEGVVDAIIARLKPDSGTQNRFHKDLGYAVTFSLVKEALGSVDRSCRKHNRVRNSARTLVQQLEDHIINDTLNRSSKTAPPAKSISALVDSLGITRFVTLNYDFEIEYASMLEADEKCTRQEVENKQQQINAQVPGRLFTTLSNGKTAISDIFSRERPDSLVEFSVSSSIDNTHILHLHGRADDAESMILGTRDYDRLYRRTDPSKQSFQHGLRVLFAGNPVLIVGIGMTEAEVNSTLQTLVSDNPYQYRAPIFLLWNTSSELSPTPEARRRSLQLARLDWLTRLGVFVIFDEDLLLYNKQYVHLKSRFHKIDLDVALKDLRTIPGTKGKRAKELKLLVDSIHMLGIAANEVRNRTREYGEIFRSMEYRVMHSRQDGPVKLWYPELSGENPHGEELYNNNCKQWNVDDLTNFENSAGCTLAIVGPAGAGKELLAKAIAERAFKNERIARLVANAGFCFDIDSLVDALIWFLRDLGYDKDIKCTRGDCSREQLLQNFFANGGEKGLIVLNGCDRFFSPDGIPLSAELDFLIRLFSKQPPDFRIKLVLIGTERVVTYLNQLNIRICELPRKALKEDIYLDSFAKDFQKADYGLASAANIESARKAPGAGAAWRRSVLRALLDYDMLKVFSGNEERLAAIALRTMAFIGMPVEAIVLLHAPAIRSELARGRQGIDVGRLSGLMDKLYKKNIVLKFQSFEGNPKQPIWSRYGLHASVLEALRAQYDVPLTESKRANAFNMSLYLAQPTDSDSPNPNVHAELGALIDHLLGAYKDSPSINEEPSYDKKYAEQIPGRLEKKGYMPLHEDDAEKSTPLRLLTPETTASLRAALHIIRGYYSTAALLTIDRGDPLATGQRSGLLQEHAERLECLLRAYRKLTRFRKEYYALKSEASPEEDSVEKTMNEIGPEPYYADELVWVYNELGVVRLAQGDLYAAQIAFDMARSVNETQVEYLDRSHNWRRIMMNVVVLDLERGKLNDAERHLRALEVSINKPDSVDQNARKPAPPPVDDCTQKTRLEQIVSIFGEQAGQPSLRRRLLPSKEFRHEDILIAAMISSLRGLLEHFRGHLRVARGGYLDGIRMLRHLGEQRAYAIFQRYYAVLIRSLGEREKYKQEIKVAIAAAESVRQMDIVYMSRMFREESDNDSVEARKKYLTQATVALEYATLTDMYRVQVEATARLARAKYVSGDYETAFEHATDAIAMASRYGMQLRKIELLILMGSILYSRGDERSGFAMIDHAIDKANHIGFQRGIERAERERARLPTPGYRGEGR